MIAIKFPALHKALMKDVKDLDEDDPRRGIIVLNDNAIVFSNQFCLVCNLFDYFTIEAGIEADDEIEELKRILFFMDGQVFSKDFWNELTKFSHMKISNGSLYVENPKYSKDLHQKEFDVNFLEPLSKLTNLQNQGLGAQDTIAIPFGALKSIYDTLPSEFKTDIIVFEFTGQDMPVKFTFRKRKHFYGFLSSHYDAAQEGFKFETLSNFVSSIKDMLKALKEEEKKKVVAPPPFVENKVEEEKPSSQLNLV